MVLYNNGDGNKKTREPLNNGNNVPIVKPNEWNIGNELNSKWEAWKRLGVLASEMEASTLFTVCASLGARSGALFMSVWNQERYDAGLDTGENESHDTSPAIKTAIEALKLLIRDDTK